MSSFASFIKKILPNQIFILQGPLAGWRWITLSSSYKIWLGSYELDKQKLFIQKVRSDKVVFDVGANTGLYSLLASKAVGSSGTVYAFEPLPRNIDFLKQNLDANHVENVSIFEAAVADSAGTIKFNQGADHATGFIGDSGDLEVETVSLDALVHEGAIAPPDYLKIDVEGAESSVLKGAQAILNKNRPIIFLAIHGSSQLEECKKLLSAANYHFEIFDEARDIHFKSIRYDYIAEIYATPNKG